MEDFICLYYQHQCQAQETWRGGAFCREEKDSESGHELTQASNRYLVRNYCVPGSMLSAKETWTEKTDMVSDFVKLRVSEQTHKPMNTTWVSKYINKYYKF